RRAPGRLRRRLTGRSDPAGASSPPSAEDARGGPLGEVVTGVQVLQQAGTLRLPAEALPGEVAAGPQLQPEDHAQEAEVLSGLGGVDTGDGDVQMAADILGDGAGGD